MDEIKKRASHAATVLKELKNKHDEFVQFIRSKQEKVLDDGTFDTDGKNITASSLGVEFGVLSRPIVVDGELAAIEYSFVTEFQREDICVWRLYLGRQGKLFTDSKLSIAFCDFNNMYLRPYVVSALCNALLSSSVFSPRP